MTLDLSAFRQAFLDEAREHLGVIEQGLLRLERDPVRLELVHEVFRAAHSIKGAAATLGFHEIAQLTHRLETILDAMRQGRLVVDDNPVTVLLHATHELRRLIEGLANDSQLSCDCSELDVLMEQVHEITMKGEPPREPGSRTATKRRMLTLEITPSERLFATKVDPIMLFRDLELLGSVGLVTCDLSQIPPLSQLDTDRCYVSWSARLLTDATDTVLVEQFLFVADDCHVSIAEDPRFGGEAVLQRSEAAAPQATSGKHSSLPP